ncbi:hypothetical protein TWF225_008632 [Orbilia oligospora]|uniref:Uncharacterized protein n=1 Tax=Orbilia oligospora TaxID=2813651 RepID=A0A7C8KL29_ORBOL|nr:hypothetical protein TWF751_005876 [Orbilia oligospora]KAF3176564.1 hypothetical protein TWF225_008632 [Orbilia oligospora]KAF3252774.1 hypothetical protein TWF128_006669 [Orbilia oligospora]KAF3252878.1 hypothetical protein TWF217_007619 [Orbilia oligospora]KAF3293233.1 hypothetical protein TWF132_004880 [Orbilia oligospora]
MSRLLASGGQRLFGSNGDYGENFSRPVDGTHRQEVVFSRKREAAEPQKIRLCEWDNHLGQESFKKT